MFKKLLRGGLKSLNYYKEIMSTRSNINFKQTLYLFLFVCILLVILASFLFFNIQIDDLNKDNFGMFGDYFGGILTPTLTFITIIYLIKSINQQSKVIELTTQQLSNSAKELRLTREELSLSSEAQRRQASLLQVSNQQSTVNVEINQCLDVIKRVQELWEEYINEPLDIYSPNKQNLFTINGKIPVDWVINGPSEAKFSIVQDGYERNGSNWTGVFEKIDEINGKLVMSKKTEAKFKRLTGLMAQFHLAFNNILSNDGTMYCYHFVDELVEQMNMLIKIKPTAYSIASIKPYTIDSMQRLKPIENIDLEENDSPSSKEIIEELIRGKLEQIDYKDYPQLQTNYSY